MADEAIGSLQLKPGDTVLDATLGGGGHALAILNRIKPNGIFVGIDADPAALERTASLFSGYSGSLILAHENFRNLDQVAAANGITGFNAALFDVGVSSFQLDQPERGFSMKLDAPLDMRMDPRITMNAAALIRSCGERELADIIWRYGDERYSRPIARRIVEERQRRSIETTGELAGIIRSAVGRRYRGQRIDPATRTFQALRIAVNDELGALEEGLRKAAALLVPGGRIAVISFHSLEDRIVKNYFRLNAKDGILNVITKKPLRPGESEAAANPRSRSGRLRVAEKKVI